MGARLYNPATGRFLTLDPVPGGNANPYAYPPDPVNGEDLDGQASGPAAWFSMIGSCSLLGSKRKGGCVDLAMYSYSMGEVYGRGPARKNVMRHVLFATLLSWNVGSHATERVLNDHEKGIAADERWDSKADRRNNAIALYNADLLRSQAGSWVPFHRGRFNPWRRAKAWEIFERGWRVRAFWCANRKKNGVHRC